MKQKDQQKRNRHILEMHAAAPQGKKHETVEELAKRYGISVVRVYEILRKGVHP